MRMAIFGGCGFIGSNFVRYVSEKTDSDIVVVDKLTYAGNFHNIADLVEEGRVVFHKGDVCAPEDVSSALDGVDLVVNFAAESHVDRSIKLSREVFLRTNYFGVFVLLEECLKRKVKFLHISTDEVYGPAPKNTFFDESAPLNPGNPYAATKAAADLLIRSYLNTFGGDVVVLRLTNNYGPYQFPEKFVPLMINNLRKGKKIPIYGDGRQRRNWLFVEDSCRAILAAIDKCESGEIYNVSGDWEVENLEVVGKILALTGKDWDWVEFVEDRPGHDRRYGIDDSKFRKITGWKPEVDLAEGLRRTVEWYNKNVEWLEEVEKGEYREYYERVYGGK